LRQDYDQFIARGVKLIALGPDGPNAFRRHWAENDLPFTGCADVRSKVADTFYQEVAVFKFGRMPAIFIIDKLGKVRWRYYGESMSDIPENEAVLEVIDQLQAELIV
jgi:peroxiredoxin Q/BCP